MEYLSRVVDTELDQLLRTVPAVVIEGARGVGKTETALRRAETVFRLDDPDVLEIVKAEPKRVITGTPPILIDEWQRYEPSWDLVRRAVDSGASPGTFILTGSAAPTRPPTHSGAGRMVTLRMRPLTLSERRVGSPTVSVGGILSGRAGEVSGRSQAGLEDYVDQILVGGFPGMRNSWGRAQRALLGGYIDMILDHDLADIGFEIRSPDTFRRWLAAYAAATATTASYTTILDAATPGDGRKPAKSTTIPYREVLERLWILDPMAGWAPTRNQLSRLTSAPRHFLADPALSARVLGVSRQALLSGDDAGPPIPRDGTLLGALFEALVALSVRVYAQAAEARVRHLRTKEGRREVDLIVERDDHRVVAIEVKLAATPDDETLQHLRWLRDRLGDDLIDAVVVTTGSEAYRREDGIAVVPAALLGP